MIFGGRKSLHAPPLWGTFDRLVLHTLDTAQRGGWPTTLEGELLAQPSSSLMLIRMRCRCPCATTSAPIPEMESAKIPSAQHIPHPLRFNKVTLAI
jgi:hypothetical protein